MSRGPQTFKQSDVVKAHKAAALAGLKVRRTIYTRENFIIEYDEPEKQEPADELDRELVDFEARNG
ncbi:MAG: hypothetical protein H0V72_19385 [Bradyrhizobium sp.]|nr:hypothetical protein [Bradyrhizobium sp.]